MPVQPSADPASSRGFSYFKAAGQLTYRCWGKMLERQSALPRPSWPVFGMRAARIPQDAQLPSADGQVPVIQLEGPLFFGSQSSIDAAVLNVGASDRVLIDISKVSTVDVSGALAFANALKRLANDGLTVSVSARGNVVDPVLLWSLEQNAHALVSVIDAPAQSARPRHGETEPTAEARRPRLPAIPPTAGAYSTAQVERS